VLHSGNNEHSFFGNYEEGYKGNLWNIMNMNPPKEFGDIF
jgi:hypothetical protein